MSEHDKDLAGLIKSASEKFDADLTAAREDLRKGIDSLSADQVEKWKKHEAAVGEAAKTLSDLTAKAETETEERRRLEERVQELEARGVAVTDKDDTEMLAARIALTQMRQEVADGSAKHLFGDETASELATAEDVKAHDAAFKRYLVQNSGKDFASLRGETPEHTFAVGSGLFSPSYGIAVPTHITNRIMGELFEYGSLRGMALMRTGVQGDSVKLLRLSGKTSITVGNEVTEWTPGDLPKAYATEYSVDDWSSTISVHRNVMMDASFNVSDFLRQEATMALGETEARYHITGDGVQKPRGILSLDKTDGTIANAGTEAEFGKLKAVPTGNATGVGHATAANASFGFNPAISCVNGLHSRYRKNSTWLMSRSSYAAFAMVRDADGNYLMPMSEQLVREGGSLSLVQRPVRINDHCPAISANSYFAICADFRQAFEIADKSAAMFALVDIYSSKPNVEITLARRSGASVADTRAIRLLKAAA